MKAKQIINFKILVLLAISLFYFTKCSKSENDDYQKDNLSNYVIAYCYQPIDGSGLHQIYTINADGSGNIKTIDSEIGLNHHNWSPDGEKIAAVGYVSSNNTTWSIHVFNSDGINLTRLTNTNNVWDNDPSWSPDGTQICFTRIYPDQDMREELWIMDQNGSNQYSIDIEGGSAKWSPDGERLIYHSNRNENFDIYSCKTDGTDEQQLTATDYNEFMPAWSPNASQIVYSADLDDDREIFTMNADGSDIAQLTINDYSDGSPKWSPDGSMIAFHSGSFEEWQICIMNADGSDIRQVTDVPDGITAINPDWKPNSPSGIDCTDGKGSNLVTLVKNYPNPFQTITTINYELLNNSPVLLKILDINGREIISLIDQYQMAGEKTVIWLGTNNNGEKVLPGIYIISLNNKIVNNKIIKID